MIFAILFFVSFVVGIAAYLASGRWWFGGIALSGLLLLLSFGDSLGGVTIYFGVPIVFFGSLFGAYIVELRRAPELDESGEDKTVTHEKE